MLSVAICVVFLSCISVGETAKPDPQKLKNIPDDETLKNMPTLDYIKLISPPPDMVDKYEDPEDKGDLITGECRMEAEKIDKLMAEEREKMLQKGESDVASGVVKRGKEPEVTKIVDFKKQIIQPLGMVGQELTGQVGELINLLMFWKKKKPKSELTPAEKINRRYLEVYEKKSDKKHDLDKKYMNIVELMQHGRDGWPLKRGDIIGCKFYLAGIKMWFDHFMIFLGQDANPFRNMIHVNVGNGEKAMIRKASVSYYKNKFCRLHNYHLDNKPGYTVADPETIIERAEALEGCRLHLGHFDLLFYNCEDFANYARYGVKMNTQARFFVPAPVTDVMRGSMEYGWKVITLPPKLLENAINGFLTSVGVHNLLEEAQTENESHADKAKDDPEKKIVDEKGAALGKRKRE